MVKTGVYINQNKVLLSSHELPHIPILLHVCLSFLLLTPFAHSLANEGKSKTLTLASLRAFKPPCIRRLHFPSSSPALLTAFPRSFRRMHRSRTRKEKKKHSCIRNFLPKLGGVPRNYRNNKAIIRRACRSASPNFQRSKLVPRFLP